MSPRVSAPHGEAQGPSTMVPLELSTRGGDTERLLQQHRCETTETSPGGRFGSVRFERHARLPRLVLATVKGHAKARRGG